MTTPRATKRRMVHLLVEGRVQGVGFRAFVEIEAVGRGLEGWVRNRRTGAVEAVFAGDPTKVEDAISACRIGPPGSRVDALFIIEDIDDPTPATGDVKISGFQVRATA